MSLKDLCEELLDEIFLRLPPKSLLRLRTVAKSFRARIDSPDFIRLHTLRSPKKFLIRQRIHHDKSIYTMHSEDQLSSYAGITPLDYPFSIDLIVVGSCNGIVCLHDRQLNVIHLWNHFIRRKLTLHKLPSYITRPGPLEFEHGFGFDPIIDDYKIVRFSKAGGTFVYTMKMNTWREVASPRPPYEFTYSAKCLFNGALHWAAGGYIGHDCFDYILRFDLSSEIFSKFELPRPLLDPVLTITKGCLAVLLGDDYSRIWVRNTAAASWSYVAIEVGDHRILFSADGGILYGWYPQWILVYNLETKARSRLAKLGDPSSSRIVDMIACTESLELLNMGTSCDVMKRSKSSKRKKNLKFRHNFRTDFE